MRAATIAAAVIGATIWTVWGFWTMALVGALAWLAFVAIGQYLTRPTKPYPAAIRRMPTRFEQERQHRWGWSVGLALTWFGPVPFITIRRHMR